jgi:hypothetical protein
MIIRLNEQYALYHKKILVPDLVTLNYLFVKIACFHSVLARALNMQHQEKKHVFGVKNYRNKDIHEFRCI